MVLANTRGDPVFLVACSGDGFTLLSKSVTIYDRSWEYVLTEELLYNRLELVPGVDVKGMVINPFSKDVWEIDIGEEYIGSLVWNWI